MTLFFTQSHHLIAFKWKTTMCFTFLYFRIEAYSAAVGSWTAKELTEERGDLLTALAPLPLTATGPLMAPFPLPFPLTPFK